MHIYFCFKTGDQEFIVVDRYGAQWSNRQKIGSIPLICEKGDEVFTGMKYPSLLEVIKCLL